VGAVFNRDIPGNRGRRPLPPATNFYLNNFEIYVVSYERSWLTFTAALNLLPDSLLKKMKNAVQQEVGAVSSRDLIVGRS
jgi:hypothetical protein